jgi:SAM-dependent methyltransferase
VTRPRPGDPEFSDYWSEFHDAVEGRPHNPFLDVLEPHLPAPGLALDVGSGRGKTAVWLLDRGFDVWALDADPVAMGALVSRVGASGHDLNRLTTRVAAFEEADFPDCRLAVSVFSLFFTRPEAFGRVWSRLSHAMGPGAVFGGQFLGPNDDWSRSGVTVQTRDEVRGLLSGFEILYWEEVDRHGRTASGTAKRWHVFHVVARRAD